LTDTAFRVILDPRITKRILGDRENIRRNIQDKFVAAKVSTDT
jgi:hypothetical protein